MASAKKTDDMTSPTPKSTNVNNNVTSSSCSIENSSNSELNVNPSITTSNTHSSDSKTIDSTNTVKTQKINSKNNISNNMTNRTEQTQTEPQTKNETENDKQTCSQSSVEEASQRDNQKSTQKDNHSSCQTEKPTASSASNQTDRQTTNQTANPTIRQEQTNRQMGSRNNRYNQRRSEPSFNTERSYVSFRGQVRYPQHRNNNVNNQNNNNRNNNNHNNSINSTVNSVSRNSNNNSNNSRRGRQNSNVSNNTNIQNNNNASNNHNASTSNNNRPATLNTSSMTNEVSSSIPLLTTSSSCLQAISQPTNISTTQTQTTISASTNTSSSLPATPPITTSVIRRSNSSTTTLINANANNSTSSSINSNHENRNSHESHILDAYDLIFDPEPARHFMCPICLQVLRLAHQTKCGHRFCKRCLKKVESRSLRGFKCPIDNTPLRWNASNTKDVRIFPDLAIDREIISLRVMCHNHTKGCSWKGDLSNHAAHIQICTNDKSFCEYGCGLSMKRDEIGSHLSKCPTRKVKCVYCHKEILQNFLTKHHLLDCSKLPMKCTACGRLGLTREDASTHLDPHAGDCPSIVATCNYAPLGCSFTSQRGSIHKHYHDSMEYHSSLSIQRVLANTNRLNDLVHTVGNCNNYSHRLEEKIAYTRIFCQQHLKNFNSMLPRVRDLETLGHDGKLFWKVKIPYTTHEATYPVNSPHFFLGSPGYRFILTIFYPGKNFEIPVSNSAGEGSDNCSHEDTETSSRNQCIKACLQLKPNRYCDHPLMFPIDGRLQIVVYLPHSGQNVTEQVKSEKLEENDEKVKCSDVGDNINTNSSLKKDHFSIERVFKGMVPCSITPSKKPYPVLVDLMTRQQLKDGGFEENNAFHVFVKVSLD